MSLEFEIQGFQVVFEFISQEFNLQLGIVAEEFNVLFGGVAEALNVLFGRKVAIDDSNQGLRLRLCLPVGEPSFLEFIGVCQSVEHDSIVS